MDYIEEDKLYIINDINGKQYFVVISGDEDSPSPRDMDEIGAFVAWHPNYNFGDDKENMTPRDFLIERVAGLVTDYPEIVLNYFLIEQGEKEIGAHIIRSPKEWIYKGEPQDRASDCKYDIYIQTGTEKEYIKSFTDPNEIVGEVYVLEDVLDLAPFRDLIALFLRIPNQVVKNVFIYEQSGVCLTLDRVDVFDSSRVGWFIVSKKEIENIYPKTVDWKKKAEEFIDDSIDLYNQWLDGEVYVVSALPVSSLSELDVLKRYPRVYINAAKEITLSDGDNCGGIYGDTGILQYLKEEGYDTNTLRKFSVIEETLEA